jgi:hypothetical protein
VERGVSLDGLGALSGSHPNAERFLKIGEAEAPFDAVGYYRAIPNSESAIETALLARA